VPVIELGTALDMQAGVFTLSGTGQGSVDADAFAGRDDVALLLHTSGTTSRPKLVPLSHANVCQSASNIATTLSLTERDRCLNVMPLFHIHGLMGAVTASITAGASLVCAPGFDPEKFFAWLDEFEPTWYTAVPTIHQAVLGLANAHAAIIARRPLRLIRSSSAAMPVQVMQDLERVFKTQVIESYGMTEAAHQMASNPLAPLPRKAGSVGIAAGPDVAIMDEAGTLLTQGAIGEVVIRGANVTRGYENNPKANESAFTNGWFRTGDQGRFDADGYLFLTGRLKEIINRGGEKIAPREVDDVLMQHPAVAQAVTFGVPHRTLGEDVAAAIVLKRGVRAAEEEIREFAAVRLAEFKTPRQVLIVDEIPKGPTGKLQRIGLADKLADLLASRQQAGFVSAQTSVEREVTEIWKQLLEVERVGTRDDFNMLGGDSLTMTAMILEVERRFGKTVPIDSFLRSPTVERLVSLIQIDSIAENGASGDSQDSPIIRDTFLKGIRNRLFQLLALHAPGFKTTRVWLHRMRGVRIGRNSSIGLSALIETAYPRLVTIGDNVTIGMRAVIIGHLRDSTVASRMADRPTVRIEDNAYIGPGVIILPNVTIGNGAVVTAGSVVNRSVAPHTLVQGNPARPIAHCGVSLGGGVSYEQFLRELKPIKQHGDK
jgi:non-ribosomal peptide synthetase component E (peptide arylation enzyme)/acetyltransferase-like isoleucine patch superfamily enzyme/acyl carrier protein